MNLIDIHIRCRSWYLKKNTLETIRYIVISWNFDCILHCSINRNVTISCVVSKGRNLRLCPTEHLMCPVCKALFNGIYRICELSHTESQWTHYKKCVNNIISSTINFVNAQKFYEKWHKSKKETLSSQP